MRKIFLLLGLAATCLGGAWAQTDNIARPKFRGCHQLSRYDSTFVRMEESGLSHVYNHSLIEMLDRTGCRNNNVVKMDYDPQSAYVEIQQVLVHRQNGGTDTIVGGSNSRPVYDYIAPARMIYWGASQKMVEVGYLEPHDQIEIRTYRKGFTYALLASGDDDARYIPPMRGHFYDIVPFWSLEGIELKCYSLSIPNSKKLQYEVYGGDLEVSSTADEGERTRYTFVGRDIEPIHREQGMVADNDVQCKLLLSTAADWKAKSRWFYQVNEDYGSFNSTPELVQKVREILTGATSEMDTISRLTHWVADNMRYCGISMGEGEGYTLHSAKMNMADMCGVCKDKAGMLVAMLRAAGFRAYAAMTMAGERIDRTPADQFNHSVCVVQHRDGRYELLDPTWVPGVRELWSSAEQQQGYLMGLPNGADLMYTPTSPADKHYLRITGTSRIKKDGTLEGTFTVTAEGQSDAAVRRVFSARMSEWRNNLERELLRVAPQAELLGVEYTSPDHYLDQTVKLTYRYRIPHFAVVTKEELIFTPLLARDLFRSAQPHLNFDTSIAERKYPFHDRCSRLVEIEETITLPAKYTRMHYSTQVRGITHPAVNYGCGFELDGNVLRFGQSAMYNKRVYDAADWPAFRMAVKNQLSIAGTPVILTK